MSGGAPRRLYQACGGAQKALLVGVENADERDFRNVEPLAQEVDAHECVEVARAQPPQDFHALYRVDVGVQVFYAHAALAQEVGNFLAHAFCQGCDEHPFAPFCGGLDFGGAVLHLSGYRADCHFGVEQACGADYLLGDGVAHGELEGGRCGGYEYRLPGEGVEFVRAQRPVVERARQPETVFDKPFFARPVAVVHAPDLRAGDVAFVDE